MNTSRRTFTVAAAFIVFARTVLTARAAPQDSSPATRKNDPTKGTRQLAEAVLVESGNDARLSTLNESTASTLLRALQKALPDAKPEWRPIMESVIQDELKVWNARISEMNVEIYATKFTNAQLLDMLVFYRTEGGRALVAQTPAIIREKTEAGRTLAAERVPRLIEAVCAKLPCQ
jgi:hypothetical protein